MALSRMIREELILRGEIVIEEYYDDCNLIAKFVYTFYSIFYSPIPFLKDVKNSNALRFDFKFLIHIYVVITISSLLRTIELLLTLDFICKFEVFVSNLFRRSCIYFKTAYQRSVTVFYCSVIFIAIMTDS